MSNIQGAIEVLPNRESSQLGRRVPLLRRVQHGVDVKATTAVPVLVGLGRVALAATLTDAQRVEMPPAG